MPAYEDALAYFITFTCYGTWLHGDARGSVLRRGPRETVELVPNPVRSKSAAERMKGRPVILNLEKRRCVDAAIRETCDRHGWLVQALNVRTNHVHLVVASDVIPDRVLNMAKGWATTRLKKSGLVARDSQVWTEGGSTRYLWREQDVSDARWYVRYGQGPDLL